MKKKVVVALGHTALGTTMPEQKVAAKTTAGYIADLVEANYQVVISHSNAPQVGMIHTALNEFGKLHQDYTAAPISVCSAMSQGYIGYDLQNAIREALLDRGFYRAVTTVLTQVIVEPYDEAFASPSKIIGRTLTREEADLEEEKGNYVIAENGGYRRILAAPKPKEIVEADTIKLLAAGDQVVIACGGGGIAVLEQGNHLRGASAVIEKDLTAGLLAQSIDADELLILTDVEDVKLNFGTDKEESLGTISVEDVKKYISQNQFGEYDMLPKMEAAINFVSKRVGRRALITSPEKLADALLGNAGTVICNADDME